MTVKLDNPVLDEETCVPLTKHGLSTAGSPHPDSKDATQYVKAKPKSSADVNKIEVKTDIQQKAVNQMNNVADSKLLSPPASDEVICSRTFPNGTVVSELRDGTRRQTTAEGVVLVLYPDGRRIQSDGKMVIEMLIDGSKIQRNLADDSVLTLSPDGSRTHHRADGSSQVVKVDGTVVETRADGVTIRLFADGSKEETNPRNNKVLRLRSEDDEVPIAQTATATIEAKNKSQNSDYTACEREQVTTIQTLQVMNDGSRVQVNKTGLWRLVIKDDKEMIQKAFNAGTWLVANSTHCTLIQKTVPKQTVINLTTNSVISESNEIDDQLVDRLEQRCALVEQYFTSSDVAQSQQQQYRVLQQKLAKAESVLVKTTQRFKTQLLQRDGENQEIRKQVVMLTASLKKEQQLRVDFKKQELLKCASPSPLTAASGKQATAVSSSVSSINLSTSTAAAGADSDNALCQQQHKQQAVTAVSAGTQWCLNDARRHFSDNHWTRENKDDEEDEIAYLEQDPQMMRLVLSKLKDRVLLLEEEKQEVEDRFIDLRISLQSDVKKKSGTMLSKLLPLLNGALLQRPRAAMKRNTQRGSNPSTSSASSTSSNSSNNDKADAPCEAGLMRKDSLLAALHNVKRREEIASGELSIKRLESSKLATETSDLRKQLLLTEGTLEDFKRRCSDLEIELKEKRAVGVVTATAADNLSYENDDESGNRLRDDLAKDNDDESGSCLGDDLAKDNDDESGSCLGDDLAKDNDDGSGSCLGDDLAKDNDDESGSCLGDDLAKDNDDESGSCLGDNLAKDNDDGSGSCLGDNLAKDNDDGSGSCLGDDLAKDTDGLDSHKRPVSDSSIRLLPSIEQEMHMSLSVSPVSPMM